MVCHALVVPFFSVLKRYYMVIGNQMIDAVAQQYTKPWRINHNSSGPLFRLESNRDGRNDRIIHFSQKRLVSRHISQFLGAGKESNYSHSTGLNWFRLGIIICLVHCSFDHLIYPYYPCYYPFCYHFIISIDNKKRTSSDNTSVLCIQFYLATSITILIIAVFSSSVILP